MTGLLGSTASVSSSLALKVKDTHHLKLAFAVPDVLGGHMVAELDELIAECCKLAIEGFAILAFCVLLG